MRKHASSCAVHNPPAFPAGPCDCGLPEPLIKPEQIPDKAWRIAADVLGDLNVYETEMRAALAAAINAWPGMWEKGDVGTFGGAVPYSALILPLHEKDG